jgi:DNA repair protein RadC
MGAENCTDAEILALLIGSGCRGYSAEDIGRALIEHYGSLEAMMGRSLREMADIKGMGVANTLRVAAAYELTRRIVYHLEHHT